MAGTTSVRSLHDLMTDVLINRAYNSAGGSKLKLGRGEHKLSICASAGVKRLQVAYAKGSSGGRKLR